MFKELLAYCVDMLPKRWTRRPDTAGRYQMAGFVFDYWQPVLRIRLGRRVWFIAGHPRCSIQFFPG